LCLHIRSSGGGRIRRDRTWWTCCRRGRALVGRTRGRRLPLGTRLVTASTTVTCLLVSCAGVVVVVLLIRHLRRSSLRRCGHRPIRFDCDAQARASPRRHLPRRGSGPCAVRVRRRRPRALVWNSNGIDVLRRTAPLHGQRSTRRHPPQHVKPSESLAVCSLVSSTNHRHPLPMPHPPSERSQLILLLLLHRQRRRHRGGLTPRRPLPWTVPRRRHISSFSINRSNKQSSSSSNAHQSAVSFERRHVRKSKRQLFCLFPSRPAQLPSSSSTCRLSPSLSLSLTRRSE